MRVFYSLGIFFYGILIRLASITNSKAKLWVNGRKNLFGNLESAIKKDAKPIIWFHCASLGEFEQGRPLMERIRKEHPEFRILLTFFSPSGYEVRKNYAGADVITYMPLDTKSNARRFLDIVNPKLVVFVKYEFWLNHLEEISKRNIPHYLISAIFRDDQIFFKGHGGIFRDALKNYTHIFTQNEESLKLISNLGINNASVAGDTRFDRVSEIAASAKEIPIAESFSRNANVIVAGSTWKADEDHLFPAMKKHFIAGWKMIIAPHEISEDRISSIENSVGIERSKIVRFSKANAESLDNAQVLIIDNIGMLSSLYRYGSIAYIGGGFGKSIHNTLEAAVYGIPVVFGPAFGKFQEAKDLVDCKGGFAVHEGHDPDQKTDINVVLNELLTQSQIRLDAGIRAADYVKANVGATAKILSKLEI